MRRTARHGTLPALLLLLAWPAQAQVDGQPREQARQLVMLLDYLAADYPRAVAAGEVRDPAEYAEQQALLRDAQGLARGLPPRGFDLLRPLTRLQELVQRRAGGQEVAQAAAALRAGLLGRYQVPTAPAELPRLARGRERYAAACAACHGPDGRAQTAAAAALRPRPAAFDPEKLASLSPFRVFNELSFGLPGTAMAPHASAPEAERWDLASYVFTLRRPGFDPARARGTLVGAGLAPGPLVLATLSDGELLARLAERGVSGEEAENALAWLRGQAAFQAPSPTDLAAVRAGFARALAEYQAGRQAEAHRALLATYLDGFEPREPALRQLDPARLAQLEEAFASLRASVEAEQDGLTVLRRQARLDALLEEAQRGSPGAAALALAWLALALALAGLGRLRRTPLPRALLVLALGPLVLALQQAGVLALTPLTFGPSAPGLSPSAEGLAAQAALALALLLSSLWERLRARGSPAGDGGPGRRQAPRC